MVSNERRGVYAVAYAVGLGVWAGIPYVVLHSWLRLSYRIVGAAIGFAEAVLTAGFLIAFFTATLPTAEQRLIARAKCGLCLTLTVGLLVDAAFAWLSRGPGLRGWLLSGAVFSVTALVVGAASWLGYRMSLNWFLRRVWPDRRG